MPGEGIRIMGYGAKFPEAVAKITDGLNLLRPSNATRPSTGSICAPRTPSFGRSRPSGTATMSPRGRGLLVAAGLA